MPRFCLVYLCCKKKKERKKKKEKRKKEEERKKKKEKRKKKKKENLQLEVPHDIEVGVELVVEGGVVGVDLVVVVGVAILVGGVVGVAILVVGVAFVGGVVHNIGGVVVGHTCQEEQQRVETGAQGLSLVGSFEPSLIVWGQERLTLPKRLVESSPFFFFFLLLENR